MGEDCGCGKFVFVGLRLKEELFLEKIEKWGNVEMFLVFVLGSGDLKIDYNFCINGNVISFKYVYILFL